MDFQKTYPQIIFALYLLIHLLPNCFQIHLGKFSQNRKPHKLLIIKEKMERAKRFEPSTPTLARLCSTTELRPLTDVLRGKALQGGVYGLTRRKGQALLAANFYFLAPSGLKSGRALRRRITLITAQEPV